MLHAFSGPFKLAVSLWPLASFVLTLPVLAVVYHRRGRITLASLAWSYLAVLYVLGLACFTCYPLPEGTSGPGITYGVAPQLDPLAFVGDIRRDGVKAVFQVVANVALFVPLGYMLSYGLRWGLCAVSLSGFAVSLLIECSQLTGLFGIYPYAYRTFDVDDLAANTLGAVCGLLCARVVSRVVGRGAYVEPTITHDPGFVRRCVAAVIDLGLVWVGSVVVGAAVALGLWAVGVTGGPGGVAGALHDRLRLLRRHPRARRARRPAGEHPRRRLRAHELRDPRAPRVAPGALLRRAPLRLPLRHGPRHPALAASRARPCRLRAALPVPRGHALRPPARPALPRGGRRVGPPRRSQARAALPVQVPFRFCNPSEKVGLLPV